MYTFAQKTKPAVGSGASFSTFPLRTQVGDSPLPSAEFGHDFNRIAVYPDSPGTLRRTSAGSPADRQVSAEYASANENEIVPGNENGGGPFTSPQESSAEAGDLTNPRFKGDPELEACYDRQRLFGVGSVGNAVAKIQSGITDYFADRGEPDPLPVYGADGKFGSETRGAVVQFQQSVGFEGGAVDGVVGHDTMDKLDKAVPFDKPPGGETPKEDPVPTDPDKPKPDKPKDPDEDCLGCKPLAKVTKVDKGVTTIFALCNDNFDVFNTGPGTAQPGPGCLGVSSNKKGVVNFRTGTQSKPAWQTTADIKDCTFPASKAGSTTPWEIGFIQTLESATFGAAYANNKFTSVTNKDARDALSDSVPAPWYDSKGNTLGPQEYPTVPMINDTPNVSFPITHVDGGKDFLRSVCMKAKFNIWLIINKKGTTPTPTNVDFLYHWSINIDQSHLLGGAGAHPCNVTGWTSSGSQSMSNKGGPGQGSAKLVWDKPIAKKSEVVDSTITTDPCGGGGGAKSVPKDSPEEK